MNGSTNTSIQPSSRVAHSEAVVSTELDGSVVMMDMEEGRYYQLDPVGTRVWALIEPGQQVAQVCEALAAEYEVAPAVCGGDVSAFLDRLLRLAVIRIRECDDEIANDGSPGVAAAPSGSARPEPPAGIAVPRHGNEPRAKLAWTPPAVRVMSVNHTASGPQSFYQSQENPTYQPPPDYS